MHTTSTGSFTDDAGPALMQRGARILVFFNPQSAEILCYKPWRPDVVFSI